MTAHNPLLGDDVSLPKEQMAQLRDVLTSQFFNSVKEVHVCLRANFWAGCCRDYSSNIETWRGTRVYVRVLTACYKMYVYVVAWSQLLEA